jgi:NAD(P)-dependent dehydrogenase (short-subunit alcohol dehydrogenase family)
VNAAAIAGLSVAVTGGANGIGRAIARRFASGGARVAIGDIDVAGAEELSGSLEDRAVALRLDVGDRDAFAAFLDAAEERHGPLDVTVNNAGVDWMSPFHEEPDEVTRREIEVNLLGTIYGRVHLPGSASYAATKHAIAGLTESLRMEYRDSGVRFSLIQPSAGRDRDDRGPTAAAPAPGGHARRRGPSRDPRRPGQPLRGVGPGLPGDLDEARSAAPPPGPGGRAACARRGSHRRGRRRRRAAVLPRADVRRGRGLSPHSATGPPATPDQSAGKVAARRAPHSCARPAQLRAPRD